MRLNLGCGSHVRPDFINIDLEPQSPSVMAHDLRKPLPFNNDSVDLVFSEHFIEHVPREDFVRMLADWKRVLKPGGWLRIATPDLRTLAHLYLMGKIGEYRAVGWEPMTPCQMMNEGMRLWGHQFVYDGTELMDLVVAAGFRNIYRFAPRTSDIADLANLETRPDLGDVVVQARK